MSRLRKWRYALVYAFCILLMSSVPGKKLPEQAGYFNDKFIHVVVYAGAGASAYGACGAAIKAVAVTVAYGAFDENYQRLVPNRDCSLYDWLADIAGAVLGVALMRFLGNKSHGGNAPLR